MLETPGVQARRLTTILPAMTLAEAIEPACLHRVAGLTGGRTALVPPAVMLTIAPPWSREMASIRKPPWDGVTEGPYGACAGPHRLGCAGGVCVCMKTPGACHMNSEWILCIRRHAYRPLVMLRAYEAPTLQSLTGYTSLVEAMNARCP